MSIVERVRPGVRAMTGYAPGEQPRGARRVIKLNTNENPYPPPQEALAAIAAAGPSLRRYPEPSARPVREAAARAYGVDPGQVVVGNGSDDLLTIILRTFIDPGDTVAAPDPTYSLYQPLTAIQGGRYVAVPWPEDGRLPVEALLAAKARVVFTARPNSPTGHAAPLDQVRALCQATSGAVVLDEAYADFCRDHGLPLLDECPNLIVIRTFSKAYSLAGLRIGLGFMAAELAAEMHKVRDSYNVDALAQAAAVAVLDHLDRFQPKLRAICRQRDAAAEALRQRGFATPDSEANFLLTTIPPGRRDGAAWHRDLRAHGVLVRHFAAPGLADKLRVSIGSPEEMKAFFAAVDNLLTDNSQPI